ncbi:hypothetical protein LTR49_026894 [Elasticomyces elasticus]|nr:hypothetical protein LTR49_026894 [Elasticomyces elasticus]
MSCSEICRLLVRDLRLFRSTWYQIMLFQLKTTAASGDRDHACTWLTHLRTYAQHLVRQMTDVNSVRIDAPGVDSTPPDMVRPLMDLLKMTVSSAVSLSSPDELPAPEVMRLAKVIAIQGGADMILSFNAWLHTMKQNLRYRVLLSTHQRLLRKQEWVQAIKTLDEYCKLQQAGSLQSICQLIDVAMMAGNTDLASSLAFYVSEVHDMRLEKSSDILGGLDPEVKFLETVFLSMVRARNWQLAEHLSGLLENASPGYFTSVQTYSDLWPWQRCLYAGLVHEHCKVLNEAHLYFRQAFFFLGRNHGHHNNPEAEPPKFWSGPEVNRLMLALCRRSLLWKWDEPHETQITPSTNQRINKRAFRMFGTTTDYRIGANVAHAQDALENEFQALDAERSALPDLVWSSDPETSEQMAADTPDLDMSLLPDIGEMYEAIPEDAIVRHCSASEDGIALLVIGSKGIKQAVYNLEATTVELDNAVQMYLSALKSSTTLEALYDGHFRWWENLLSGMLIEPCKRWIDQKRVNHVIFVPTGLLSTFPVGALLFKGQHLILQKQVSQAPSLTTLRHLAFRPLAQRVDQNARLNVVLRPGSLRDPQYQFVPMAGREAVVVAHIASCTLDNAKHLDRRAFQDSLRNSDLLHITTHGQEDTEHPFLSHIALKERFRVLDMLAVRTQVSLVTLSACFSSVGNTLDSGDVEGFSHAILAAAANAFLGSLCKVNDVATMLHMYLFYFFLLAWVEDLSLAEA